MGVKNALPWVVLGLDPGRVGAIAALFKTGRVCSARFDTKEPSLLDEALDAFAIPPGVQVVAFIEDVFSRPGEGHKGVFSFGLAKGTPYGFLAARGYEVRFISPQVWQTYHFGGDLHGLDKDARKAVILAAARKRWAKHALPAMADEARAAALFIGLCGVERELGW